MAADDDDVPNAQPSFTVVVPMTIQALVIADDFARTAAQFAPLIEPDYGILLQHPDAGALTHDLMDKLDLSYWRMQARYSSRFINYTTGKLRSNRRGVYLSWCLPRVYRAAITATESAFVATTEYKGESMPQWESRKARAGFKTEAAPDNLSVSSHADDKAVQFRSAPDRWIVVRHVPGKPALTKRVLIESNCVRRIDHHEMPADIEAETCPAMDTGLDIGDPPLLRMGRSSLLTDEKAEKTSDCHYRQPFNAFELGHEFFADYSPHNMGVFSYFDDLNDVEEETINYLVMGYHSSPKDHDPLTFVDEEKLLPIDLAPGNDPSEEDEDPWVSNRELLKALHLTVDEKTEIGRNFAGAAASYIGRTLTQGILRNVRWNRANTNNLRWPAASLQEGVYSQQPISIGTHLLDALSAYLHITIDANKVGSRADATQSTIAQLVMRIMAQSEDPDSLWKAAEDAATRSFLARSEGTVWQLPKDEREDTAQDPETAGHSGTTVARSQRLNEATLQAHIEKLKVINNDQLVMDSCAREATHLVQRLFGCWWNSASLQRVSEEERGHALKATIQKEARKIASQLTQLAEYSSTAQYSVKTLKDELEALIPGGKKLEATPTNPFGQHQDPVMLIAGAKSGWPMNFNDVLPVRLASQVSPEPPKPKPATKSWLEQNFEQIYRPAAALLRELESPSPLGLPNPYTAAENMNSTQGWFPLFLEWELEYYHVPFSRWRLEPDEVTGRWRYIVPVQGQDSLQTDEGVGKDMRVISGRTAFLPEAGQSLGARLEQLFNQTPAKSDEQKERRESMLRAVRGLEYFSAPLSGLSDHLVTLRRGHHPRPSADDKQSIGAALGIDLETVDLLVNGGPSTQEVAPYGLSTFLPPWYTSEFSPFKPVTHGQARFIKFAIVDKFGQVVSGLRLGPTGDGAMYPSIPPSLACGVLPARKGEDEAKYWPNTVVQAEDDENGHGLCQFFQVPPRINQRARLNTHFLEPLSDKDMAKIQRGETLTREVSSEWNNPIWAWLLPNFQSQGIQVYAPTGEFLVEFLLDTTRPEGRVIASDGPSSKISRPILTGRLPLLLQSLREYEFCSSLFEMLASASDSVLATSVDFDNALPAALGRPFCVADVGVSIELSAPPLQDASLLSSVAPELELVDYNFPIALGNPKAAFDGLVGTFPATGEIGKVATKFHVASEDPEMLHVKPYFLAGTLGKELADEHLKQLTTLSVIMDPKTPIHAYSGSLFPVAELSLPRWPVDDALREMRAFFSVGPILVPAKPPPGDFHVMAIDADGRNLGPTIQMPLGGGEGEGKWRWLQPRKENESVKNEDGEVKKEATRWSEVNMLPLDRQLKVEASSLSELVEGYVVVQGSLEQKTDV